MSYHYFSALKPLFDKIKSYVGSYSYSKEETDTKLDTKVNKTGDTMTGKLVAPQKVDFHEYGAEWNFYKNTSGAQIGGKLVAQIKEDGVHAPLKGNADTATSATRATQDADGNPINTTYRKIQDSYSKTEVDTKDAAKADKATTLSGYGITDAYTKTEVDTKIASSGGGSGSGSGTVVDAYTKAETDAKLSGKADKATTLNGYGITDTYTKTEIDAKDATKADKSTTISGYGITDAYTKTEVDSKDAAKADKATSLAGYGITDAYTKTEIDAKIASSGGSGASDSLFIVNFKSTLDTSSNKMITTADKTMDEIAAANDAKKIIVGVYNTGGITFVLNACISTADPSDIQATFTSDAIYVSRAYNDEITEYINIDASYSSNSYVWSMYGTGVERSIDTITIPKTKWDNSNKTAVIDNNTITENSTITVSPTSSSHSAYVNAGILATKQETNKITFQCDEIPTVDIEVSVMIRTLINQQMTYQ